MNQLLNTALFYASMGWSVFPIKPHQKKPPLIKKWQLGATKEDYKIRKWWKNWPDANIAVATGKISGFVALDIDIDRYGDWALKSLSERYKELPITITSATGSGGRHILFEYPKEDIHNSSHKIGPGLDIRGDGGYIILPPSHHPNGTYYEWIIAPWTSTIEMAHLPEWMAMLLKEEKIIDDGGEHSEDFVPPPADNGQFWIKRALEKAESGIPRNETGMWLACQLRDDGFPIQEAYDFMMEYVDQVPKRDHPYTISEAIRSLNNAFSRRKRKSALAWRDYELTRGNNETRGT